MDYLTTVEAAKKWNISSRMAAYYCEAGRVKGAVKKGKSWLVPVSAEKPVDKRHFKKTVKHKDDRKRKGNGDLFTADHGGGDQASAIYHTKDVFRHLGFTREQLCEYGIGLSGETAEAPAYDKEVKKLLDTVKEYEERYQCRIPTALGGGIENRKQAMHAFSLGVDAIQVATRFVTTEECDADVRYKEAYIKAGKEDIAIVKSPVGMPGRAIMNPFVKEVMAGEKISHSPCHGCLHNCRPAEIPYCITDALIHAAKGEVDDALLFCGAYAYKAKGLETVKEVVDSLLVERV